MTDISSFRPVYIKEITKSEIASVHNPHNL